MRVRVRNIPEASRSSMQTVRGSSGSLPSSNAALRRFEIAWSREFIRLNFLMMMRSLLANLLLTVLAERYRYLSAALSFTHVKLQGAFSPMKELVVNGPLLFALSGTKQKTWAKNEISVIRWCYTRCFGTHCNSIWVTNFGPGPHEVNMWASS